MYSTKKKKQKETKERKKERKKESRINVKFKNTDYMNVTVKKIRK